MALATLNQLKTQLGFKTSDTQYDPKLQLFLDAASQWVETYCDRIFSEDTYTELFHGNNSNAIHPRQYPITAVTELRVDNARAWSDPNTLIDSASYGIDSSGVAVFYYDATFPSGYNNVRAIYTAGYATIPSDIQMAVIWTGEWFYHHNNRGDSGRTSKSKGGENAAMLADVPPMIKTILQKYKRLELPFSGLAIEAAL